MGLFTLSAYPLGIGGKDSRLLLANKRKISDGEYSCSELVIVRSMCSIIIESTIAMLPAKDLYLACEDDHNEPDYGSYYEVRAHPTDVRYSLGDELNGRFGAAQLQEIPEFLRISAFNVGIISDSSGSYSEFISQFTSAIDKRHRLDCFIMEQGLFRLVVSLDQVVAPTDR